MIRRRGRSGGAAAVVVWYHMLFRFNPAKAERLLRVEEVKAYKIWDNRWGPGFVMLEVPYGLTTATAEKTRIVNVKIRTASMAILTSYDSIFLPRYSGVRPTISPAMKTAITTKTKMP